MWSRYLLRLIESHLAGEMGFEHLMSLMILSLLELLEFLLCSW